MATNRIAYPISAPYTVPWHGAVRSMKVFGPSLGTPITAADVTTVNDTVALFTVPKGFTLVGMHIDVTRMDTNGAPTLTLDLGDTASPQRLLAASTIAQAAESEANVTLPAGALGFRYPADTDIVLTVHAAAATPQAGTFTCFLFGFIDA
jgi:hypothetical protein